MNARFLGLVGVVAAVVAGCKSDPTNSLVGHPARVGFQFATVRLEVADSLATYAVVLDAGSNALTDAVTVTACDPTTVSVSQVGSGAPLVRTNFFIKGVKFGIACVIGTADGFSDTMQVATVPDAIKITGGPDTVLSGDSGAYTFQFLDKKGAVMAGVPVPSWTSTTAAFGGFPTATAPTYDGAAPGVNTITATLAVSALGGTVTQTVSNTKTVTTIPGVFSGTFSSLTAAPATTILATGAVLGNWDADASVTIGGVQAFVARHANDAVRFVMPPFGDTKNRQVGFVNVGAGQVAQFTNGSDSVKNSTASLDGPYAPGDTSNTTASAATMPLVHGDTTILYDINHGTCSGGSNTDPGDHCNAFWLLNNTTATPDTIIIQLDWVAQSGIDNPTTGGGGPDQDILLCDSVCGGFVGNFNGATTKTPENTGLLFVPPHTKWYLWINLFDPAGQPSVLFKVTISHK